MKAMKNWFIVSSLLLALVAAPRGAAAGDFVIAQNGHARAVVVVEGGVQSNGVTYAVNVLADATRALDPECATVASGDAKAVVTGSEGDEAWQVVSLGVLDLKDGATIVVTPRTAGDAAPRSIDVRRIVLVNPAALK